MAKSKRIRSVKKTRKNINKRKSYKQKGGECPCQNKTLFGGSAPATFNALPSEMYKPANHANSPLNPSSIIASRNLTGGRKSRKNKRSRGRKGKLTGGGFDAISSFGSIQGAYNINNSAKLLPNINPAAYDQPTLKMYGVHNAPLV